MTEVYLNSNDPERAALEDEYRRVTLAKRWWMATYVIAQNGCDWHRVDDRNGDMFITYCGRTYAMRELEKRVHLGLDDELRPVERLTGHGPVCSACEAEHAVRKLKIGRKVNS